MSRSGQTPQAPESYVVRIYRRNPRNRGRVAGTVEIVASGTEHSFASLRELQQILGVAVRPITDARPPR
jgi:hypothetical protein